jgi:hypothetical protein
MKKLKAYYDNSIIILQIKCLQPVNYPESDDFHISQGITHGKILKNAVTTGRKKQMHAIC